MNRRHQTPVRMLAKRGRFTISIALSVVVVSLAAVQLSRSSEPSQIAKRIDAALAEGFARDGIAAADIGDDAGFARRVHLDLLGRIPTVSELRAFETDESPDKRTALVERLVGSDLHARRVASLFRDEWIGYVDHENSPLARELETWFAQRLQEGWTYDRIVREALASTPEKRQPSATAAFMAASEYQPERLAANSTRAFLGLDLECAQCHDHPFDVWTREQFWEATAFFVQPAEADAAESRFRVQIPDTGTTVAAKLLFGPEPSWPDTAQVEDARRIFAEWISAPENERFASHAVNVVWRDLLGRGLDEPASDDAKEPPGSHVALLAELGDAFAESGFDLRFLTSSIVLSKAYQQSSVADGPTSDSRRFAVAAVRNLTGEQLYDSVRVAAGYPLDGSDLRPTSFRTARDRFAVAFRSPNPVAAQRSILQSLALMNGEFSADATDAIRSPALQAISEAPFLNVRERIDALYLATIGRHAEDDELSELTQYLERGGPEGDQRVALADLFWALLNSSEFCTNH